MLAMAGAAVTMKSPETQTMSGPHDLRMPFSPNAMTCLSGVERRLGQHDVIAEAVVRGHVDEVPEVVDEDQHLLACRVGREVGAARVAGQEVLADGREAVGARQERP